jgi:hypothetical protein
MILLTGIRRQTLRRFQNPNVIVENTPTHRLRTAILSQSSKTMKNVIN